MLRTLASLSLCLAAGCSLGKIDNPSGGDSNLPTLGAGPFAKPLIDFDTAGDEPYVVSQPRASLSEPMVLDRDDGGFRIWYSRQADDEDTVAIWYSEIPSIYELPDVSAAPALSADADWEEGRVAAPSIAALGDGTLIMMYEGGITQPMLGVAFSDDGGKSWEKSADNPVVAGAMTPTLGSASGELMAVWSRVGDETALYAADSGDGVRWSERAEPIVSARLDDGAAFDRQSVASPSLTIHETATGRLHFGLHFVGRNRNGEASIGYAGSFDGESWERFFGSEAVLSDNPPEESGPSLIVRGPTAYLFFEQPKQLRGAIAVAVHPG